LRDFKGNHQSATRELQRWCRPAKTLGDLGCVNGKIVGNSEGAQGYKPFKLLIEPMQELELKPVVYAPLKILYFARDQGTRTGIRGETPYQPGCKGKFFVTVLGLAWKGWETPTIVGKLDYQACDKTRCYLPSSVSVKWQLQAQHLDRTRAPSIFVINRKAADDEDCARPDRPHRKKQKLLATFLALSSPLLKLGVVARV